ncbi:MAG: TetR/AcrR family transcriptional regulator [Promethearchaeota archaeon]
MKKQIIRNSEHLTKKEQKILRNKNIILDAAKELFSKKKFNSITMEEIADLAALSRATLYNYFNTKEEIYFSIGISKLKQWIEQYKLSNSIKNSGEEQILMLTEKLVRSILEFPFYSNLLRRFFYRSKEMNLPIEKIFYNMIIEKKNSPNNSYFKPQNQIFLDLLECYIIYRELWQKSIEIGIKDGSIKSTSNPTHLNFTIIMSIFGFLDQIDFRRSLMTMIGLSNEDIIKLILRLTKKFLEGVI